MQRKRLFLLALFILLISCGTPPKKEFYLISYDPAKMVNRKMEKPYPYTLRVKKFDIEKVYGKSNIVYRESPFKLEYYGFRHWAVRPADMLTDLILAHATDTKIVEAVVRRLDEASNPDYELTGLIDAIEEFDSDEKWFAHLSIRYQLKRLSDEKIIYTKVFDNRRLVNTHTPTDVVKKLSEIMDMNSSKLMQDIDSVLFEEYAKQRAEGTFNE